VLAHLHRENAHFDAQFAPLAPLQATIYKVNIRSTAMLDIAILRRVAD
jgi:hypothetical protein